MQQLPALSFVDRLTAMVPAIVGCWSAKVDCAPWSRLTTAQRVDHLPRYLEALFDWLRTAHRGSSYRFLEAAAEHGQQRRLQGLSYDVVMEESAYLRRAIWECGGPNPDEIGEMIALDSALTVGLMASLRGYARGELSGERGWRDALEDLATDWTESLAHQELVKTRMAERERGPRSG